MESRKEEGPKPTESKREGGFCPLATGFDGPALEGGAVIRGGRLVSSEGVWRGEGGRGEIFISGIRVFQTFTHKKNFSSQTAPTDARGTSQ